MHPNSKKFPRQCCCSSAAPQNSAAVAASHSYRGHYKHVSHRLSQALTGSHRLSQPLSTTPVLCPPGKALAVSAGVAPQGSEIERPYVYPPSKFPLPRHSGLSGQRDMERKLLEEKDWATSERLPVTIAQWQQKCDFRPALLVVQKGLIKLQESRPHNSHSPRRACWNEKLGTVSSLLTSLSGVELVKKRSEFETAPQAPSKSTEK